MASKCRHCGSTSYGHSCIYGPNKIHEHRDDEKHCEWCGSTSYGRSCIYSPNKTHRHGPGGFAALLRVHGRRGFGIIHAMKIDERCLPYAEEMKTCGYCAEGEYLAAIKSAL